MRRREVMLKIMMRYLGQAEMEARNKIHETQGRIKESQKKVRGGSHVGVEL